MIDMGNPIGFLLECPTKMVNVIVIKGIHTYITQMGLGLGSNCGGVF